MFGGGAGKWGLYSIPGDRRRREREVHAERRRAARRGLGVASASERDGWNHSERGDPAWAGGGGGWRQRVVVFEMIRPICASFPRCTPRRGKPARIPRHRKHRGSPVECHILRQRMERKGQLEAEPRREEEKEQGSERNEGGTRKGGETERERGRERWREGEKGRERVHAEGERTRTGTPATRGMKKSGKQI